MKLLLVLALCALSVVNSRVPNSRWLDDILPERFNFEETVFRPEREYRFIYNGQLLTGIPSSSKQHSGTRIQAVVSLFFKSEETCVMKITHIRMGKLNRRVPNPRVILPFMAFESAPISEELKEKLEAPVKFTYTKGLISNVVFDGVEQPWSANIKRSVLNLLQVNLEKKNLIKTSHEALNFNEFPVELSPTKDFFRVMERTMEGECETFYTVVSEPHPFYTTGPVMNITKTIDFEKCNSRPQIKYNFRFQEPCPTCNSRYVSDEKFLKSSSVFSFNISGTPESFLIERSKVESHYILVPFNEEGNVIITYVNQTLVLFKSGPFETEFVEPRNPIPSDTHMIWTPDWDILKEKFFMEGEEEFHEKTPFPGIPNKVEFVSSVFRKLVTNMRESVEDPAPRYFDVLVKFFRVLKRRELEVIWRKFFVEVPENFTPEEHKKIKSFIVDAMAFSGTKDNVVFLIEKIKSRQIPPFLAALAVKSFINIKVVSKDMITELLTLAESEVCRTNFFLKQSVYLTAGSMMNALCSPNEDLLALEFKLENPQSFFCPRELKQKFVETLFTKFRACQNWECKVLFIKTISNAGLDLSVFELEKIIKNLDERFPTFLRSEAVLALRQIAPFMPRKVQQILMPIFMNRFEPPELRIVCAYQIFQTLPPRPILEQMAKRLFSEPSRQVVSFVFTYMHTMANSTIPCEKRLAEDMKLALRHSRFPPFAFMIGYSKYIHKSVFFQKYNFGFGFDFAKVFSNSSYFPKHLAWNFNPTFGGFWSKRWFTMGLVSEGFENMFWKYFGERGSFFERPLEEVFRRSPRSVQSRSPLSDLKTMFESLRIRPREYFPNRPRAFFYMKVKDQEFGFLPFSFDSLPEEILSMFESGSFDVKEIERFLESGYNFQFYKGMLLHEMSYKIPTTIGFPLRFRVSVPTVMSLTGQFKAEFTPERRFHKFTFFFNELKPSFVSTWFSDVQIWNPVVNSGLKVLAKVKFFYPFTGKMELDLQKSPKEFLFSFEPPTRSVHVMTFETRPLTYTFFWPQQFRTWEDPEEVTIMGEDWSRVKKYHKNFGEYLFGVKLNFRGLWHRTPVMKLADTPFCPLSGPNKFIFFTEPGYQMPKEIFFKFIFDFFKPISEEFKPEFRDFENFEESHEPFNSRELRSFVPKRPTLHNFKFEVFTKSSSLPRRFFFESLVKCSMHMKYCRFSTKLERTPIPRFENEPFKLCFDAETLFPLTPMRFSDLVGKKAVAQFKLNWGTSCTSSDKFVKLDVIGERSRRQVEHERTTPEFRFLSEPTEDFTLNSPVFQYEHLYKFSQLLKYKFDLEYQNLPVFFKNYTNFFFRYFKHYYFWQTDVAQINVRNPRNKVRGVMAIDPLNKQYFNFTVKTPFENTTFVDIPIRLPYAINPVNIRKTIPFTSFFDYIRPMTPFSSQPVCHVSSRYIKTFDKVKYTVPFSNCWTVLVKDCGKTDDPNFGVFMKKINMDSEMKKLKIVTPYHRFLLYPEEESYESVKIEFNGRKFDPESFEPVMDHGHVVARVEKIGSYVKFILPETGVKIFFDGYSVNIKLSHFFRNIQCGLCGHFDNEPLDEFRLPNFDLTEDVREFYRSYTLNTESCTLPELNEVCTTHRCEPTPNTPVFCPVCKSIFNEVNEMDKFTKRDVTRFVKFYCEKFPRFERTCKRFFEPKVEEIYQKIKNGKSLSELCTLINACSSEFFNEFDSERFPYRESEFHHERRPVFPVFHTKVLEQNHQLCFSKQPVPVCPHHSYAIKFKPEKRVVFTCLHRDDPQAELFFRKAFSKYEVLDEVKRMPASFTETVLIPETCEPLF